MNKTSLSVSIFNTVSIKENKRMRKKVKRVFLIVIAIILLTILFLNIIKLKTKTFSIKIQVDNMDEITKSDYSKMGEDYTKMIFDKYDAIKFGKQKYGFLNVLEEPIEWIILEKKENAVLLLSKYIIDCKPFYHIDIENIDNIDLDLKEKFKDVNWNNSTLREWLNEDFLNESFNDKERRLILSTHLEDINTDDKIFCLNQYEYEKYFDNGGYYENNRDIGDTRIYYNGTTIRNDKAKQYDTYNIFKSDDTYDYWLRDKDTNEKEYGIEFGTTKTVNYYGDIDSNVDYNMFIGVRPAMWVSLE